jgi:tRNA uridine 5-carboxymethylaminomethyl modification enzyme
MDEIYKYEVVVIGGGFAGSQAAMSSAVNGAKTLMISINLDSVSVMPFGNIIGSDKSKHIIKKMEKFKSVIPKVISDKSLIEIKETTGIDRNIIGGRIIDKKRYSLKIKELLEKTDGLDTRQGLVVDIIKESDGYRVITSDNVKYSTKVVILCTGTFLNSEIFWGKNRIDAGRIGEIRSLRLYKNMKNKDFKFRKKCIYTAPEIDRKTINTKSSNIIEIKNHGSVYYISFDEGDSFKPGDLIKSKNLVLLPAGADTGEMYVYGFENGFSEESQIRILRNYGGLGRVEITKPGYGIRYWVLSSPKASRTHECEKFKGMFFAGRINGTNTYEHSLIQGMVAGINASRRTKGLEPGEIY